MTRPATLPKPLPSTPRPFPRGEAAVVEMRKAGEKIMASKEATLDFMVRAGILNKSGKLSKKYK